MATEMADEVKTAKRKKERFHEDCDGGAEEG